MIGKRLIIVGADYSDVSIGKLKISITSTKLTDGETATLTLSAPSVSSPTFNATTSGSIISLTGSNPYTITGSSTDGTQDITCTLTYTEAGKSITETKKLTITVENESPAPGEEVWYNELALDELAINSGTSRLISSPTDEAQGTLTDGCKVNRLRFRPLNDATNYTIAAIVLNSTRTLIEKVITITLPSVTGLIVTEVDFGETITIENGQKMAFWSASSFAYRSSSYGSTNSNFLFTSVYNPTEGTKVALNKANSGNIAVDFGYKE